VCVCLEFLSWCEKILQVSLGIYRFKPKDKLCLAGHCVITVRSLKKKKYTKCERIIYEHLG
jgi:hypothetical protein